MRATISLALSVGFVLSGAAATVAGDGTSVPAVETPADVDQARETLTDLLFSDNVDRIDFQAATYEEGTALVTTSADRIIEAGVSVFGDANQAVNRGVEVIRALNSNTAKGMYLTFGKDKQTIFVRDRNQARMFGDLVGTTMSIINEEYGSGISYQDKAGKLFGKVRVDPEDAASLLEIYMDTIDFVRKLPSKERVKYFR